ncbi:WD repeat-containing protein 97-like [Alligator sinensis]|uniref:WD repeat-containing protein 97-like n=1 Tax=Alligator sinensis TaxID=38654 RepID=A0A3Q0HEC4_ALLSI|nr:WD repeat-containing protein 97-like [Alligator sinensis]
MCTLGSTLAVALHDPESATYRVAHYDLQARARPRHPPEDDPLDEITGLCCCPRLKLFASSSRDGSVKVWNRRNQLLRHLKLNTIPHSLAFANDHGDLLVGIERHLYRIQHSKYLPRSYLLKLVCSRFVEPTQDPTLSVSVADALLQPLPWDPAAGPELGGPPRQAASWLCPRGTQPC